jgi:hypothetical protein
MKKMHWLRLLKQVEHGKDDYKEYGIPKVRTKSYQDLLQYLAWWDHPHEFNNYRYKKDWKRHRKTQYKGNKYV